MTLQYEDEVQLAPGIYLTKKKEPATIALSQEANRARLEREAMLVLESNPKAHLDWLKQKVQNLENTLRMLHYSNEEILKVDPNLADEEFKEAIDGNIICIKNQKEKLKEHKKKVFEISKQLGICMAETLQDHELDSNHEEPDSKEEEGIYL
jgi:hypothetical protein